MSTNGETGEQGIHTTLQYSVIKKKNELPIPPLNMGDLQNIMWVKEALHKRIHSVGFYLYDILEYANLIYDRRKKLAFEVWGHRLIRKEHEEMFWGHVL